MVIERQSKDGYVENEQAGQAIAEFFAQNDYTGKRLLLIVPDNTRSGPVGDIFKIVYDCLEQKAKAVHVLIALGTHQPLTEEQICRRLGMNTRARSGKYAPVKFFNHEWQQPEALAPIGRIWADEIDKITDGLFREEVDIRINKLIFDYDEFFILGPVFPHEVVGFSGGHKYIFPGIAGAEIIDFFHWLGAVCTNPQINGNVWTPPRKVVEKAASFIKMPRKLFAIVSVPHQLSAGETTKSPSGLEHPASGQLVRDKLKGLFIGDCIEAWEKAARLSEKVHIVYKDKPYKTILAIAPKMYDDIWTAAKAMYKLEPIVADGGTLIIYAPHITEISYTHGKFIDQIGYHTRDYFLKRMDKFADIPRAVTAHSTHLKGIGTYIEGVEKPRINVVLATAINRERCRKVNLGYMNPEQMDIANYEDREDKGILLVHHAGEMLHRLANGYIPTIPNQ